MASDFHDNELKSSPSCPRVEGSQNSPSKIRGGQGALNVPESNSISSDSMTSGSIDAPALTGTPSCPRGGVSHNTQHVMNTPEMKNFRRELRSHGTSAEGALWNMLKRKQIAGLQFRRQYSVGNHILDFYCPALKLAIELDGDYHYHMDMPDRDWRRDQELLDMFGIKTLRFENNTVFRYPESIRFAILQVLEANYSPSCPGVEGSLNSPSKIRGGQVALKVPESNNDSSDSMTSGCIDAPALTGSPSYPRGGVDDDP